MIEYGDQMTRKTQKVREVYIGGYRREEQVCTTRVGLGEKIIGPRLICVLEKPRELKR